MGGRFFSAVEAMTQITLLTQTEFVTGNLDLALTKLGAGVAVTYDGPHQGVFRFESVKLAALRSARFARPEERCGGVALVEAAALRRFFAVH
jgi:hypothetical protein